MFLPYLLPAWSLGLILLAPSTGVDDEAAHPGRALFVTACAPCHGEDGSGVSRVELERPARSFRDGGFSFGNTPSALLRTITNGIPGSPMPSFADLPSSDLALLADYVRVLGPPGAGPTASVLSVADRPLVVRAHLPPIDTSARAVVRGMLIGLPDGLSLEYRVDDGRLLGVRVGDFVDRSDWSGRGGTPVRPLGRLLHVESDGAVFASWSGHVPRRRSGRVPHVHGQRELVARLVSTRVQGHLVSVRWSLHEPVVELPEPLVQAVQSTTEAVVVVPAGLPRAGAVVAQVEETARLLSTPDGPGLLRHLSVEPVARASVDAFLLIRLDGEGPRQRRRFLSADWSPPPDWPASTGSWWVDERDGTTRAVATDRAAPRLVQHHGGLALAVSLADGAQVDFALIPARDRELGR